jgi:hypothetical protein
VVTVHNLVIGKLYVDVNGKTQVTNLSTGDTCYMEYKERGWSGKNANLFSGVVKSATTKTEFFKI